MSDIREIKKKYEDKLRKKKNVVGVETGEKEKSGIGIGVDAIVVLVEKKVPKHELKKKDIVPEMLGGYRTDVKEIGKIDLLTYTGKHRPAPPGVSIGNCPQVTAGTFGCVVKKDDKIFILSNSHVLSSDPTKPIDEQENKLVSQPGNHDLQEDETCESAQIGTLVDNVPVHTAGKGSCPIAKFVVRVLNGLCRVFRRRTRLKVTQVPKKNKVDCAIAEPLKPVADYVKSNILDIGVPKGVKEAQKGDIVEKTGRTTQHSKDGKVESTDATIQVFYGEHGVAVFEDQIRIKSEERYSKGGDSGSAILIQDENQVTGLLFAGNRTGTSTFANHISNVEDALDIEIVTEKI